MDVHVVINNDHRVLSFPFDLLGQSFLGDDTNDHHEVCTVCVLPGFSEEEHPHIPLGLLVHFRVSLSAWTSVR